MRIQGSRTADFPAAVCISSSGMGRVQTAVSWQVLLASCWRRSLGADPFLSQPEHAHWRRWAPLLFVSFTYVVLQHALSCAFGC